MSDSRDETTVIEECLERLRAGDLAARDSLLQFTRERLYRRIRKLMLTSFRTVHRWEETDDVFQQAVIRLERAMSAEVPTSASHFFRLAGLQIRRELIDLSRRLGGPEGMGAHHHTEKPRAGQYSDVPANEPIALTAGPETLARWTEFHETVEHLPPAEREIFDLHYYAGLQLKAAATTLGVDERTVKRRWRSARRLLHKALHGQLPGDK